MPRSACHARGRWAAIDAIEGLAIAAVAALVMVVVAWQTMPAPDRIDRGVMRRGMVNGLLFASVVGVIGALIAFFLIARAFGSFTGW